MLKNAAIVLAIAMGVFLFRPYIKSLSMELRMGLSLSRIEMVEEQKEELDRVFSRVGNGFEAYVFDETEMTTLRELMAQVKSYEGREMPEADADRIIQRFESILKRYKL
ncbi:MAG: hypothetical protein MI919_25945 [Holophagales bacterium]|nr:hypothetical protein [Holophagales bacterium]